MKKINIFALGVVLAVCASSCEMKDELVGGDAVSTETGALELSVAMQGKEGSRADANVPEAGDMYVEVVSATDADAAPAYEGFYKNMEKPLTVFVGDYKVSAHTEGDIQKQMDTPYYYGEEPKLTITKDVTSQADVSCKIMNTKVTINYAEEFLKAFTSWEITIDNGKESSLKFTNANQDAAIYWYLEEDGVTSLLMNFTGTTAAGTVINWQRPFTKADAIKGDEYDDTDVFVGGDELNINLDIEESQPEGDIEFDITVDLTFANTDATAEIPVGDETTPTPPAPPAPGDDPIAISDNDTGYLTSGVTVPQGGPYPTDVAVVMGVKYGIQNLYVKIESTNDTFRKMVADMGLVDGNGMDLTSAEASELSSLFALPQAGNTEYTFTMSETLFGMLGSFAGKHDFTLTIVDAEGNQESATLTINI